MKKDLENKVIWVTGASSGIGRSLAVELASMNNKVYVSARNKTALQELHSRNKNLIPLPADITNLNDLKEAMSEIEKTDGFLDIAVLNAGTCEYVDVKKFDSAIFERILRINFLGTVYSVEASLPLLRKSKSPYIVGVASSVAYVALPIAEAYGASKAAMKYFLESLRIDLMNENIDVSVVCPGFVKTPLTDKNDFYMPMRISAEESSKQIISGMKRRKKEIHYPKLFTCSLKIIGLLPYTLKKIIYRRMKR